jgi:hypothetical protein
MFFGSVAHEEKPMLWAPVRVGRVGEPVGGRRMIWSVADAELEFDVNDRTAQRISLSELAEPVARLIRQLLTSGEPATREQRDTILPCLGL